MFDIRILFHLLVGGLAWAHIPITQPVFKSIPSSLKILENATAILPCTVENLGESVIRWWRNEILLADSSDPQLISPPRIKMWQNKSLQIEDLEPGDAGEYVCKIIRPDPWSPLQQVHSLQVLFPPRVFLTPKSGYIEVGLGDEVQIGCMADGVPPPVVTITTKGEKRELTDNRHLLKFKAENRLMSGTYLCEAHNGIGNGAFANINLRILYKPEITVERNWIHSSPGVRAELKCIVSSDPESEVEWLYNGSPVDISSSRILSSVHGDSYSLLMRSINPSDFGNYTCKATNVEGEEKAVIELTGVANPAVFKRDISKPQPDSHTLIWEVDSYSPIIEYKLFFKEESASESDWITLVIPADGHVPGPIHSKSYTLTGLKRSTVYDAKLCSRNRFGWSDFSTGVKFATEGANNYTNEVPEEEQEEEAPEAVEEENSLETNMIKKRLTSKRPSRASHTNSKSPLILICATSLAAFILFH